MQWKSFSSWSRRTLGHQFLQLKFYPKSRNTCVSFEAHFHSRIFVTFGCFCTIHKRFTDLMENVQMKGKLEQVLLKSKVKQIFSGYIFHRELVTPKLYLWCFAVVWCFNRMRVSRMADLARRVLSIQSHVVRWFTENQYFTQYQNISGDVFLWLKAFAFMFWFLKCHCFSLSGYVGNKSATFPLQLLDFEARAETSLRRN